MQELNYMYRRSVTFHTGWVHTRTLMEEPLELIANGDFDPRVIETAVVGFDRAADAFGAALHQASPRSTERVGHPPAESLLR